MKNINLSFIFGIISTILSYGQVCDSLIAAYNFNGNVVDITGHGYDLTVFGATLANDRFGNPLSSYKVNRNNYLEISTNDFPQLYQNFSYSIWYKPDSIFQSLGPIWMYGNDPDSCDSHFALIQTANMMGSSRVIDFWAGCLDSTILTNIGGGIPGWCQITVVKDGTQIRTYLNGFFSYSNASFPTLAQTIFTVGSNTSDHNSGSYGIIDDLYIYNCALSDSEVITLYINSQSSDDIIIKTDYNTNTINISCGQVWINSSLKIYDMCGRIISSTILTKTDFELSFANLLDGYYILSLASKIKVCNTKLLLVHN